jgi:hypothetical protein
MMARSYLRPTASAWKALWANANPPLIDQASAVSGCSQDASMARGQLPAMAAVGKK